MEVEPDIPFIPPGFSVIARMHGEWDYSIYQHILFGVTGPRVKWIVYEFFKQVHGINPEQYLTLCHPMAAIFTSSHVGAGNFVEPGVCLSSFARTGFGVSIKRNSAIGHHSVLGDFVNINPAAVINGRVNIGHGTVIGAGAIVLERVRIGANCIIGAGSVVTRDIPDGVIAYGSPCKTVRQNEQWSIPPLMACPED